MKWGRQRRQQQQQPQQQQQQQQQDRPSSAFSLLRVFPLSWIPKLKLTRSKTGPPRPTVPDPSTAVLRPTSHTLPDPRWALSRRLSPDRPFRPSSASDHLSFSPALLDRLVFRAHGDHPDDAAPRRHSCAGDDDARFLDVIKNRTGGVRPFSSSRFPDVPLLSCRSCRGDPERYGLHHSLPVRGSSETLDNSPETGSSDEGDPGRRGPEATQRRPPRARRATRVGAEDVVPPVKPAHTVDGRGSDRTSEKGRRRRQFSGREPGGEEQRGGRRSFSGKARQRSRVKVYSPRAAAAAAAYREETWRVRAAAKEKKDRKKAEEEEEEEEEEERGRRRRQRGRSLESFAVVKCSLDPQRDFRESMVEMIEEKGMGRPEEMEGLLACYLSLNSDEYHDVIVKVFRQVWLDINPPRLASESEQGDQDGSFL